MKWGNPRAWLELAYDAAGDDVQHAAAFWPSRRGPLEAQVLEDLQALLQARRVLEPVARTPDLLVQLGHLCADLARVHRFLGDNAQAIRDFEAASRAMVAAGDRALDQARVLTPLAGLLRETRRPEEARAVALNAVELCRDRELDDRGRQILGTALFAAASLVDDIEQAVRLYDEAIDLAEATGDRVERASVLAEKAARLQAAGDDARAAPIWARADEAFEALNRDGVREALRAQGMANLNRALLAESYPEMLRHGMAAANVYRPLVVERGLEVLSGELGESLWFVGVGMEHGGDVHGAIDAYTSAREYLERAVTSGGRADLSHRLARASDHAATLVRDFGDPRQAVALARAACDAWERLVHLDGTKAWGTALAQARGKLASCLGDADEPHAGLAEVEAELRLLETAAPDLPPAVVRQETAQAYSARGVLLRQIGDFQGAAEAYRAGLEVLAGNAAADDILTEAMLLMNLGNAIAAGGDLSAAIAPSQAAIDKLEALLATADAGVGEALEAKLLDAEHNLYMKLAVLGDYELAGPLGDAASERYRKLIARGRHDLQDKFAMLLAQHAATLERVFEFGRSVSTGHEAVAGLQRSNLLDPAQRDAMCSILSRRIRRIETLGHREPEDLVGWLPVCRQNLDELRDWIADEPPLEVSSMLEDMTDGLVLVIQRYPIRDAFELCAEAAAGAGLVACSAGRTGAAERAFELAIDGCRTLTDGFPEIRATPTTHRVAEADPHHAARLATTLCAAGRSPEDLQRSPWLLTMALELAELR